MARDARREDQQDRGEDEAERLEALAGYKKITVPFDGVVTARDTDVGALISAGGGVGPAMFVVSDVSKLRVYVNVPQNYVPSIKIGAKAALPDKQVVVLHGDGPSFCSGLDVMSFAEAGGLDKDHALFQPRADGRRGNAAQRAALDWADLPMPVIAAIHGNCLGGGLQIALGADIRISHPDAKLSIREMQWGLIPDMGITVTLPPLVPADVAKELVFTARIFDGREGHKLGLATRLSDDPHTDAMAMAREIAALSPDAVRGAKELLNHLFNAGAGDQFAKQFDHLGLDLIRGDYDQPVVDLGAADDHFRHPCDLIPEPAQDTLRMLQRPFSLGGLRYIGWNDGASSLAGLVLLK